MFLPAPNYTQAPNICFDEIFKNLKEGELRVILVLIRQTFGWHKPFDRISLSQISEKSGIDRRSVCRSLNSLMSKGLIIKKKFGDKGKERCYYSLVMQIEKEEVFPIDDGVESEEEMELISNNSYQCPKVTTPSDLKSLPQCPKVTTPSDLKSPTKETNSKETIQKKQQQAAKAAVSLNSKNEEKPEVYSCLDCVDIPHSEKIEITKTYDLKKVQHALLWLSKNEKPLTKGIAAALKWACKVQPEIPKPKEVHKSPIDFASYNKSYFREISIVARQNGYKLQDQGLRESTTDYIETETDKIYYKDQGFLQQIENFLRKKSISCRNLFDMIKACQNNLVKQV